MLLLKESFIVALHWYLNATPGLKWVTLVINAAFNGISTLKTCAGAARCFWGSPKHYPSDWKPAGDWETGATHGRFLAHQTETQDGFLRTRKCQYPATSPAYREPAAGLEGVCMCGSVCVSVRPCCICVYAWVRECVFLNRGKISWSWENNIYY